MNKHLYATQEGAGLSIRWGKVKEAKSYKLFAAYADKAYTKKATKIVKGNKTTANIWLLNGGGLDPTKNFKVKVVACYEKKGKEKLGESMEAFVAGSKNSAYSNVSEIVPVESSLNLKKGKQVTIQAHMKLEDDAKLRVPSTLCSGLRYASSKKKVATVSKKGRVTAKKSGRCQVYVYAANGKSTKVSINVN